MKKAIIIILGSLFISGCAHIKEAIVPYLPKIEAGAADKGFGLQIDTANLGINQFCLSPEGKPYEWLKKIPFGIGDFVIEDLIGVCEVEAVEEPSA